MDFPGGPVVKTQCFHCKEHGLSPGQGTKIPHASQHGRKIEGKKKAFQLGDRLEFSLNSTWLKQAVEFLRTGVGSRGGRSSLFADCLHPREKEMVLQHQDEGRCHKLD